jgi:hypothetical protein
MGFYEEKFSTSHHMVFGLFTMVILPFFAVSLLGFGKY